MSAKFFRLVACLGLALALGLGSVCHADGIEGNVPFKLPFKVDGKAVAHRAVVTVGTDGVPVLTIDYAKGEDILTVRYTLTRQDSPTPNPDPTPDPTPDPVDVLYAIVVEESKDRTPDVAAVIGSKEIRGLFPTEGGFRLVDPLSDGVPVPVSADVQLYADRAIKQLDQWPMLYLVSAKGTVFYEGKVPIKKEDWILLVKKHTKSNRGVK